MSDEPVTDITETPVENSLDVPEASSPPSFFDPESIKSIMESLDEPWTPEDHVRSYADILNDDALSVTDRLRAMAQFEKFMDRVEGDRAVRGTIRRTKTTTTSETGSTVTEEEVRSLQSSISMTAARDRGFTRNTYVEDDGDDGGDPEGSAS